jgi:Icc-related predicted phosphoesterase
MNREPAGRSQVAAEIPVFQGGEDVKRVHVVSDVHGRAEALARAADGADVFICLGDLLCFLDYSDPGNGIFAELFGAANVAEYIDLRTEKRFDEASRMIRRLFAADGTDGRLEEAIRRQYSELFEAMPEPAYLTYGNVDLPSLWGQYARPGHHVIDGGRAEIGGVTFGFVGGGLISPYRTPNEITPDEFAAKLAAAGPVDVLCTHIPPAVPELLYDTVARRMETGSQALLETIRATRPRYSLFGHVHQPLARRVRVGRTECVNVGHFRATGLPFVLDF